MTVFTIIPRGRGYLVEAILSDGSRKPVEWYDAEDQALTRLRALRAKAERRDQMITQAASVRGPHI
jgi:hypothetical protein